MFAGIGQLQRLDTLINGILSSLIFGGLVGRLFGEADISPGGVVAANYLFAWGTANGSISGHYLMHGTYANLIRELENQMSLNPMGHEFQFFGSAQSSWNRVDRMFDDGNRVEAAKSK